MFELLRFVSEEQVRDIASQHPLPLFVYSRKDLAEQAKKALGFKAPFGLTVRYAMKANPHPDILKLFDEMELHVDASSEYEAYNAMDAGIPGDRIALNSQQLPNDFKRIKEAGVIFTATSLHQLEVYGEQFSGSEIAVRLNPGDGSGASNRVTTGGRNAGFGIWYEYIPQIKMLAQKYNLTINKVHTHIGAGTDPTRWLEVAKTTLELAQLFDSATTVSLGGGFKVGRMSHEESADLDLISTQIDKELRSHADRYNQKLHLEIEPGTFLTANAGILIAEIIDIVDTGPNGHVFIRTNTGMNDILRPTLYGAQHPITVVPRIEEQRDIREYLVIGHNCESGDILTPAPGDPEGLTPRQLSEARIGDYVVIGGAGAYCASMRARGYNSYPDAGEILID